MCRVKRFAELIANITQETKTFILLYCIFHVDQQFKILKTISTPTESFGIFSERMYKYPFSRLRFQNASEQRVLNDV